MGRVATNPAAVKRRDKQRRFLFAKLCTHRQKQGLKMVLGKIMVKVRKCSVQLTSYVEVRCTVLVYCVAQARHILQLEYVQFVSVKVHNTNGKNTASRPSLKNIYLNNVFTLQIVHFMNKLPDCGTPGTR